MSFWTFVAVVCLAGIIYAGWEQWLRHRRMADRESGDALREEVAALEERVRVLERIVTDEGYELRREISGLETEEVR